MTRLRRFFSAISLLVLIAAALVFGVMDRIIGLSDVSHTARTQADILAQAFITLLEEGDPGYQDVFGWSEGQAPRTDPRWQALADTVIRASHAPPVTRLSVLDRQGRVLVSTSGEESDPNALAPKDAAPEAALRDSLRSVLTGHPWHHDDKAPDTVWSLGPLAGLTGHVARYPLRADTDEITAILDLRLDTRALLAEANHRQTWVMVGLAVVLGVLYLLLQIIVERMARMAGQTQAPQESGPSRHPPPTADLMTQARLLRTVADSLPALMSYVDRDLRYWVPNIRYQDWFGIPADQMPGRRIPDVVGPDLFDTIKPHFDRVLSGEAVVFETYSETIGAPRTVRVHLTPDITDTGEVQGFVTLVTDISDLKRLEKDLRAAKAHTEKLVEKRTAELKASEQRFRDFAEASSDWFWECDAEFRITWISAEHSDPSHTAFRPDSTIGYTRHEIFYPRAPELADRHQADLDAHRPFRDFVFRWIDEDTGAPIAVTTSGKPVFDETGCFLGYRGVSTDISGQNAAEARATKAEAYLMAAMDSIGDGFVLWDSDDRLVLKNAAFERSFSRLDTFLVLDKPFEDIFYPWHETGGMTVYLDGEPLTGSLDNRLRRTHDAHRNGNCTLEIHDPVSGTWILVTERPTRDGGISSLFTDITHRKQSEIALRRVATGLRELHRITSDAGPSTRPQVLALLRFGAHHFGLGGGALLAVDGETFQVQETVHPGWGPPMGLVLPRHGSPLAAALTRNEPLAEPACAPLFGTGLPSTTVLPDAEATPPQQAVLAQALRVWDRTTILVFFADAPRPKPFDSNDLELLKLIAQWLVGMLLRERHDREIRLAKDHAEAANRTKSEFLANMSHELRTPLNAIIGFSDVMLQSVMGPVSNPTYEGYLRDIHASGKHLLEIINDILDVSKIEAGRLTLIEETTHIAPLVDACERLIRERADLAHVGITVDDLSALPPIHADERRLKQVVLNLLSNAVKFTPKGGQITISGGLTRKGALTVTVTDSGIGMTPEEIAVALIPFGQAEAGLDRRQDGTGLGLPLSRALMRLHSGTLRIDSEKGKGTRVTITLPASRVLSRPEQMTPRTAGQDAVEWGRNPV